jgi:hypothetical protein
MSLIAKAKSNEGGEFVQVPVGMHLSRCYRIVDMGTQKKLVQGNTKFQRTVMLSFEVHGEDNKGQPMLTEKGDPLSISRDYNLSLNEASHLAKHLEGWRGAKFNDAERAGGFDIKKILGVWGMINVTSSVSQKNGKTYHNIDGIMPVPKMVKDSGLPEPHNEIQFFGMQHDEENPDIKPDLNVFNNLSQYFQNKIKESPEWDSWFGDKKTTKSHQDDEFNDDIPF